MSIQTDLQTHDSSCWYNESLSCVLSATQCDFMVGADKDCSMCLDLPVIYTFNNSSQVFVAALLISLKTVLGNSLPATTAWSLSTLLKSANARVILSPFFLPREPINVCSDSVIFDFFLRSLQAERFSVVSPPTVARRNIGCNFWQIGTVMSKILF